ncbi:diguanylate cyclase [Pseudomonas sp. GOM6]|uniref:diguanylate cyclase domain-containing protein n=1 Tax=Pseudomonas sp. GOM6 TaxID=3036944 RepID=UPI00240A7DD6|nr:diguanylate cyclase [Pseudomonas sp. GOM6]MDG1580185.1 diguanylate cyclase [Pseudomonas sp. GOM6]
MESWIEHRKIRPKLLVVDDQPLNIRVLNELFRHDHDVFMATRGEQAIAICREQRPDLVLLDVVMEGMDGYQVCRELQADPLTRDIPIIFVSAKGEEEDEAFGLELGAVDYISKPFNSNIVRARAKTHLTLKLQSDYLRSLTRLDGMTGIANRRCFDDNLNNAWAQACRSGSPLSLLMIDIDYFKRYNDHYGHQQGDLCLKQVAMALAGATSRPSDLVARYGGEEFACLLPDTQQEGAILIARKMLTEVEALAIAHPLSDVGDRVSLSIGVATLVPSAQADPTQLVRDADEQLYKAKHAGRGRMNVDPG